ncbi:AraC family transcriptional regulator ligand-binding domain-containing protein [Actinoplanes sp. NPDC026670]|uniref:AraC family transcriptional regulator ligand-binding domain-containing protein n=1 Tax=Actinoplanes sp. NPDC026670 TaxID=3154700 RepID=UPI0034046234
MATVRAAGIRGFAEVVRELGADPLPFVRAAGLDPAVLDHDDLPIEQSRLSTLLQSAAAGLNCPDLGLRMAARHGLDTLGPLAVMLANCRTGADALATTQRYLTVHSDALHVDQIPDPDGVPGAIALRYRGHPPGPPPVQATDAGIGFLHRALCLLFAAPDAPDAALRADDAAGAGSYGYGLLDVRLSYYPAEYPSPDRSSDRFSDRFSGRSSDRSPDRSSDRSPVRSSEGSPVCSSGRASDRTPVHDPDPSSVAGAGCYERFYRAPVRFGEPESLLRVPEALLARPISGAHEDLRIRAEAYLRTLLPDVDDMTGQIRTVIDGMLVFGAVPMEAVARALSLHPRTLQRRLAAQGTTFAHIVDNIRRDRARQYLTETTMPFGDVSSRLGFAEQATFSRACHRWWGVPPRRVRATRQGQQAFS